ncbi:hypothetical protein FDF69_07735 [Clostridium sporogenes]|uniref:Uncharacterized protein n=1 Tax=Clostridium botulinum TaxID=1491 RepID=A0A6G4D0M5_CLOBO|nr:MULTISPECIES: hypothetical protein [Clostridium]KEI87585.1 hypothetical protein N492_11570 [Clostridium botulinum B2 267]MDU6337126.1 hypothetical protein [Clostridium sporogenes]NFC47397.1 hypothetical protein [Clostridium botulinum]NFF66787.1 hypothetical protein [Clostridium sporogenes]NFF99347.1 hypothetical protein [Clostridium sporogenes]
MLNFIINNKESLSIIFNFITSLTSIIVVIFTYRNLRELKIARFEESRAYITFYIDKFKNDLFFSLIIKNFGKSSGKLISIKLNPPLDWSKTSANIGLSPITECKNIYLAPGQSVKSLFDFRNYPDKIFSVTVTYETLGKVFTDNYEIDLSHRKSVIIDKPCIKTEFDALESIHKSIEGLSEKVL